MKCTVRATWPLWRVVVFNETLGRWDVWAAFALEYEAFDYCERLVTKHDDRSPRVVRPGEKLGAPVMGRPVAG